MPRRRQQPTPAARTSRLPRSIRCLLRLLTWRLVDRSTSAAGWQVHALQAGSDRPHAALRSSWASGGAGWRAGQRLHNEKRASGGKSSGPRPFQATVEGDRGLQRQPLAVNLLCNK